MIGPLSSQLNAIKWGEFRLGDLFEKIIIKPLPYQTAQLPKEKTPTHELPALTAGILNQGLNNFVPKENATILKNVISISANGANTGATFYQPHEFCVLQDAYAIEFIGDKKLNDKEYLFFVSAISKVIYNNSKYEWTNKASWNKVKNELISLPLKPTANTQTLEDIDFHFMEKFIAELEQCRLAELEAYLKATGLENTTLSNDEENALNVFNGNNSGGGGVIPHAA
ncbi:type I restriction modification DNA specificity domain family protein [Helicobacter pylori NQ4099]|uniref:Type I restriction modification DNA specificity domain family protein n=1 Tax=Helicobacter pylori NQ4099 TaxID=992026 RepID=I9YVT0_HELPX|nr:restriction endonuclease subunit S [Helicobacter pylori]EJB27758.1 type I restriction modification DNA specificity domain family protein [Helicobacter pylori NQ4099]